MPHVQKWKKKHYIYPQRVKSTKKLLVDLKKKKKRIPIRRNLIWVLPFLQKLLQMHFSEHPELLGHKASAKIRWRPLSVWDHIQRNSYLFPSLQLGSATNITTKPRPKTHQSLSYSPTATSWTLQPHVLLQLAGRHGGLGRERGGDGGSGCGTGIQFPFESAWRLDEGWR